VASGLARPDVLAGDDHDSISGSAVDQPAQDWFFAEGSQGFFQTFVLVINPNATPTDVTFTFLRENEPPVVKTVPLGAAMRLTLDAGSQPHVDTGGSASW
jgi:hypothetical protein